MKSAITGSHFTPAQAVIAELKKSQPEVSIIYIGRKYTREGDKSLSAESQIIPELGVKFIPITTGRLQRRFTRYTISSLLKIPVGLIQSMIILIKEKPDVVVSFGGYVGVPVIICAWVLSIPVLVHEQTLVSGLANQIGDIFADKIAVSFDKEYKFDKKKLVLTGNPIREEILHPSTLMDPEIKSAVSLAKTKMLPVILITGGNQGSHIINQAVGESLKALTDLGVIIHQTGESKFNDYEKLENLKMELPYLARYVVKKWVDGNDMGALLKQSNLIVSRAGANTLLEIAYWGTPTLLIPLPYVQKDEQNINAKFFHKLGLAEILPQSELTNKTLVGKITELLKHTQDIRQRSEQIKQVVIPDASKRLAQEIILLVHQHTHPSS